MCRQGSKDADGPSCRQWVEETPISSSGVLRGLRFTCLPKGVLVVEPVCAEGHTESECSVRGVTVSSGVVRALLVGRGVMRSASTERGKNATCVALAGRVST